MSTLVRYANPVNSLINEFFSTPTRYYEKSSSYKPAVDIVEEKKAFKLYANLPGLSKKDVAITVEDGVLSIKGEKEAITADEKSYSYFERPSGSFERKFNLPENVDADKVSAEMKDGELIVTIEKAEKALPKKIEISVK